MKKFLFASAFALMRTFALANETKTEVIEKSENLQLRAALILE